MKETLERLSKITAPVCATIVVKTHKTYPDNQQDPILLKNQITEANRRLKNEFGDEIAERYTAKLNKLADQIDHSYNDNGLILFVNDDVEEYVKLPTNVNSRVILDDTFATRSIVRALKGATDYYILVLTKGKARLIQASSDNLVKEFEENGFPYIENTVTSLAKSGEAVAPRATSLTQAFYNHLDKAVNAIRKENPAPVIIFSDEQSYFGYLKEVDYPNTILGNISLRNYDEKASNIVKEAWIPLQSLVIEKNRARIDELGRAIGAGTFLGDLNDIWTAVKEGRGKTIFVEEGYYQAATMNEDGSITPIDTKDISTKEDNDDIIDDMIEHCLNFGGDVVFLEEGTLDNFEKIALVTRY